MEAWRVERFWAKVSKSDTCWLWTAAVDSAGYGRFRTSENGKLDGAHRVAFMLCKGDIPKGLLVCHSCDVKLCVNPDHLFLGTDKDNAYDYYRKYGHPTNGERNGMVKLTRSKVVAIRALMSSKKFKAKHIADVFGINRDYVYTIARGLHWKHI